MRSWRKCVYPSLLIELPTVLVSAETAPQEALGPGGSPSPTCLIIHWVCSIPRTVSASIYGTRPEALVGNVLQEVHDTTVLDTMSSCCKQIIKQPLVAQPHTLAWIAVLWSCGKGDQSRPCLEKRELKITDQSPGVWLIQALFLHS